jgi:hypothetical protein
MKNIICLLFFLWATMANAQEKQKKPMQWGFMLGLETQSLGIESLYEQSPDEAWVESNRNKPGVTVGVLGQKKIWRGLSFESGLSLSYTYNKVVFHPDGPQKYEFTDLELPIYAAFTNQKNDGLPLRAKVLFGPRIGWNLAHKPIDKLQLLRERVALDLGLGVEISLGKWKLCPEAIYSHGLNNLHDFTSTNFDFLIGRVVRDKVSFRVVLMQAK